MNRLIDDARRARMFALFVVLTMALAACAGNNPAPGNNKPAPTTAPTQPPSKPSPTAVAQAPLPEACALLTLDDVKQAMSDFDMTGPESAPSAYGGNACRFRGHSDSLKATAVVDVIYLTQAQFEPRVASSGAKKIDSISGATAYQYTAGVILLNKGNRYVRFSIDLNEETSATLDQLGAGMQKWVPQLAQKVAARIK